MMHPTDRPRTPFVERSTSVSTLRLGDELEHVDRPKHGLPVTRPARPMPRPPHLAAPLAGSRSQRTRPHDGNAQHRGRSYERARTGRGAGRRREPGGDRLTPVDGCEEYRGTKRRSENPSESGFRGQVGAEWSCRRWPPFGVPRERRVRRQILLSALLRLSHHQRLAGRVARVFTGGEPVKYLGSWSVVPDRPSRNLGFKYED